MSSNLERKFREAVNRFQARDLAGAEQGCREVLSKAPRHPEALHLLGMVRLAGGNARDAVALINQAVERDPRNPSALENLGLAYLAAGDAAAAEPHFRRALDLGATHATLQMRLGLALLSQRRLPEAVAALRAAAAREPGDPDVLLNLGNALAEEGKGEEALACFGRVLALYPDHSHARFNIGAQLRRMGRLGEAELAFLAVLSADPRYADALHNLGLVYQQQGRLDDAASRYRQALALVPDQIQTLNNLGNVLVALEKTEEAIAHYEAALRIQPNHPDAYLNLGNVKVERQLYSEAQVLYEKALQLEPGSMEARLNIGKLQIVEGRLDDAVYSFERALALDGDQVRANLGLAVARLLRLEFEQGWPGYERRLAADGTRQGLRKNLASVELYESLPRWRGPGEALGGEVAIWGEQGIGDQVLFSTLIPELIEAGVPFVYEVDRRLLAAYERAFPPGRFVPLEDPPQEALRRASRVLLSGSLPGLFRTSRERFARQPARLLGALPERVAHYQSRLAALGPGLKVALSWRSTRKDFWSPRKTFPLIELAPLLKLPGPHFVDVQYGDTTAERRAAEDATGARLMRFEDVDHFNDLEELLAILEASDLVITTSNATAHFAGALGKRTWLLYPAARPPFYYWTPGGSHRSLWYPSVEIVTAPQLADWPSLIGHVAQRLALELAGADRGHA